MSPLIAAFFAAGKAIQFFQDSVRVGAEKTQAATMLKTAYGADSQATTLAVNEIANKYGINETEAQKQAAVLRQTLPEKQFSNQQIPQLLETESVYSHQTGGNAESMGRLNYAMSQIATSAKLMGQDWLQVVNASPALIKPLQELTKTSDTRALRDKLKTMTGGEVAKLMVQAMERVNKKSNAAAAAMNNVSAKLGNLQNGVEHTQKAFYDGYSDGFKNLLTALTGSMDDSTGIAHEAGTALGWFFNRLTKLVRVLDTISMNVSGYIGLIKEKFDEFYKSLSPQNQKNFDAVVSFLNDISSWAIGLIAALGGAKMAMGTAKMITRMLGAGSANAIAAGNAAGSGGSAAGRGALTLGKVTLIASSVEIGMQLGNLIFDKLIPDFQKWAYGDDKGNVKLSHGGNAVAGSPVDKAWNGISWLWHNATEGVSERWHQTMNAPILPSASSLGASYSPNIPLKVQSESVIKFAEMPTLKIEMPDGSIRKIALDAAADHLESKILTANGHNGSWQSPGDNAGWHRSSLMRKS